VSVEYIVKDVAYVTHHSLISGSRDSRINDACNVWYDGAYLCGMQCGVITLPPKTMNVRQTIFL